MVPITRRRRADDAVVTRVDRNRRAGGESPARGPRRRGACVAANTETSRVLHRPRYAGEPLVVEAVRPLRDRDLELRSASSRARSACALRGCAA
jgi:hypothetical protein